MKDTWRFLSGDLRGNSISTSSSEALGAKARQALQAWHSAPSYAKPWFCWACAALPVRKWDVQECSQTPDLLPPFSHAWNSRDTTQHLQRMVGPGVLMPQHLSFCGLNIKPWPLLWGVSLLFGTVLSTPCLSTALHNQVFFVLTFCWPNYWEAKGEVQLNWKGKAESGSAKRSNKAEKHGEAGEYIKSIL